MSDAIKINITFLVACLFLTACYQGRPSDKPPIHINPNMDKQQKYKPQAHSEFFSDGSAMRKPPAGTVARGQLREDDRYYKGRNPGGSFVKKLPVSMTSALLKRGQERFNIYCSPCHSRAGDGRGIVVQRGYPPPTSFHDQRLRNVEDGYMFDVITNGLRNMPNYRAQIPTQDRWAIVAYLRALQRSQYASLSDVPEEMRAKLKGGVQP